MNNIVINAINSRINVEGKTSERSWKGARNDTGFNDGITVRSDWKENQKKKKSTRGAGREIRYGFLLEGQ